jgi:hypothetical protein
VFLHSCVYHVAALRLADWLVIVPTRPDGKATWPHGLIPRHGKVRLANYLDVSRLHDLLIDRCVLRCCRRVVQCGFVFFSHPSSGHAGTWRPRCASVWPLSDPFHFMNYFVHM